MLWSLFLSRGFTSWRDETDDPESSDTMVQQDAQYSRVNILYHHINTHTLDNTDTVTLTPPIDIGNAPTEDCIICLRVTGQIKLTWTGKDINNSSALTGYLFCKGSEMYPGNLWIQSYNFDKTSGLVLTSEENGTVVDVFIGVKCDDDDARLTSNA